MKTIEILKTHNAWRRGDDTRSMDELGFSVTELGIAIDDAVRAIQERNQLRADIEKERDRVKMLTEALEQAKTSMLDSGYSPGSVVIRACNSALSAGEGETQCYMS